MYFQFSNIFAQDNTMYMLHQLPQANILNPAVDFPCKYYIELPVLSSTKFVYNNSSFTYKDVVEQGTDNLQNTFTINLDNLYQNVKKNNYINLGIENVLIGVGFHLKDYTISARIYHNFLSSLRYTKNLIGLKDGSRDLNTNNPINYKLSGNELSAISYWGISAAISKKINPYLRLGVRLSYLKGTSNFSTRSSNLEIVTTDQPLSVGISTEYEVNASFPLEYERNANDQITSASPVFNNFVRDFIFNSNSGVSSDFGAVYEYSDKIKLSASVLNLGFIRWASNSLNIKLEGELNLSGSDLNPYMSANQNVDLIQVLNDTITSSFQYTDNPTKYTTLLPLTMFAGGTYKLNPVTHLGLVGKIFIINGIVIPSLTGTANYTAHSLLNLTASISYANRTFRNVGFAAIIGKPSFNFYFVTDMMPIKYVTNEQIGIKLPNNSRSFNFRFGFNILLGCGNPKKRSSGKLCPAYR